MKEKQAKLCKYEIQMVSKVKYPVMCGIVARLICRPLG